MSGIGGWSDSDFSRAESAWSGRDERMAGGDGVMTFPADWSGRGEVATIGIYYDGHSVYPSIGEALHIADMLDTALPDKRGRGPGPLRRTAVVYVDRQGPVVLGGDPQGG